MAASDESPNMSFDEIERRPQEERFQFETVVDKRYPNKFDKKLKRNKAQRERDYEVEASLYLRGMTHAEIARELQVRFGYFLSLGAVAHDLTVVRERWLEAARADYDRAKALELAKVDELERAYWRAWENSLKKLEKNFVEKIEDKNPYANAQVVNPNSPNATYVRTKIRNIKEDRGGLVAYLQGIQWCIEQRCKILGLNAPTKMTVVDWREEAKRAGIDNPGDMFNELVKGFITENGQERKQ